MVRIGAGTSIGAVALRVRDLQRVRAFYLNALGLRELVDGQGPSEHRLPNIEAPTGPTPSDGVPRDPHRRTWLGAPGSDHALIELIDDLSAPSRPPRSAGLFHLAILVPDRVELGRSLSRLLRNGSRLSGASHHLVSEALYLEDPEGTGIEIYRDRPREEWDHTPDGDLEMATLPLDVRALLEEAGDQDPGPEVAAGTRIGHVHLNVAELEDTERFYAGALGFEVTVRSYPGALFVAADRYHHHIGLNTWRGPGAPPTPQGSRGLEHFEILIPSRIAIHQATDRLDDANFKTERLSRDVVRARDPSGNRVILRAGTA